MAPTANIRLVSKSHSSVSTSRILLPVAGLSLPEENSVVLPMTPQRTKFTIRNLAQGIAVTAMAVHSGKFTTTIPAVLSRSVKISMVVLSNPLIALVALYRSMTVISDRSTSETTTR